MQLARTTAEQRHEVYTDVRSLLRPGFLSHQVTVNGVPVSLRSFVEEDFFLLRHRVPQQGFTDKEWASWTLAASIWMVGGQIVLQDQDVTYRLYEMCMGLPTEARTQLYSIFVSLMKRLGNAADVIEGYLYEDESRFLWRSEGETIFRNTLWQANGLGGWNPIQRLWAFYNKAEDRRETAEQEWQIAAFQVGPHAPKGIKKVEAKNRKAHADLERQRKETMDRIYYEWTGLIAKKKEDRRKGAWQDVQMAYTREELQEEMRNWVLGIKDDHDKVVDGIKTKIKSEVEKRERERKERAEAVARAFEEEGLIRSQLQPFSGPGAQDFLDRMRARVPGTKTVVESEAGHNSAYDKYIRNNPDIGNLRVDKDGNIVSDMPVSEEMLEVLTKPKGEATLQDKVSARRPTLHYGDREKKG